jgi:phage terminase small subunit
MALTDKQRRFVDEYLIDFNATAAYKRAGYKAASETVAASEGFKLLRKPKIAEYLSERQKALQERTEITQDMVLKRWWEIATADPNELVQYRRLCCRHCWGIDNQYQWTESEFLKAQSDASENSKEAPDGAGGIGYDVNREPNPDCPECGGEGRGKIHVNDTRRLKGAARLLYAGVKSGKEGLEVKMQDQAKALENVARHIGMFKNTVELTGKDGGPVEFRKSLQDMTDDELLSLATGSGAGAADPA